MTATLRPPVWTDIAELAAYETAMFGREAWSEATWWGELASRPRREYVVAVDGSGICGYAGLDLAGESADVMTIATLPRVRGTGLGRRLLAHLVERAASAGARQLLLEVRADNEAALGLYAAAGFAEIARRRAYYGDGVDALVLRRELDRSQEGVLDSRGRPLPFPATDPDLSDGSKEPERPAIEAGASVASARSVVT